MAAREGGPTFRGERGPRRGGTCGLTAGGGGGAGTSSVESLIYCSQLWGFALIVEDVARRKQSAVVVTLQHG